MAQTIDSSELGEDQTKNQPGQQSGPGTGNSTQAGQAPVQQQGSPSAGGGSGPQANNANSQKGSGYTNISKVINANQGNGLGSAIGNNIQNVENSAQSNLKNAQNQFQQQTSQNQANTQDNQQLSQDVLNDPTKYSGANASNQQQGQQFQNLLSGQYQGPTSLANANNIQNQAANVAQLGQSLGSSGGRIGLLQQLVGNKQYGAGQANLDNLLLGQSNDPSLQAAKRNALTLQGQVGSALQGAQAQGQQQTNQAQQFGNALQNQLGSSVQKQNDTLQQNATQLQQGRNKQYNDSLADLQSGNVSQDEASLLGLTQGENVYNTLANGNASKFLTENPLAANVSNTASAQDYAKMQALQNLAGQYAPKNAQAAFQNFQNPSQASQFQNSQALIGDQSGLANAVESTGKNYHSILDPVQSSADMANKIYGAYTNAGIDSSNLDNLKGAEYSQNAYNAINALGQGAALGGNLSQNYNWAKNNQTTQAQNLANTQTQLQNQFGTPTMINIAQPQSAYPGLARAVQGPQERFPTVS